MRWCIGGLGAGRGLGSHTHIAQAANDFQDFAARGKHAAARSLVGIEGLHEGNFFFGIVALASCRVDLSPPGDLLAALALAALDGDGLVLFPTVFSGTAIRFRTPIDGDAR
jgi:hypothetical protein